MNVSQSQLMYKEHYATDESKLELANMIQQVV